MGIQKKGSVSFMALALSIAISMGASTSVALATISVYLFSGPNHSCPK